MPVILQFTPEPGRRKETVDNIAHTQWKAQDVKCIPHVSDVSDTLEN